MTFPLRLSLGMALALATAFIALPRVAPAQQTAVAPEKNPPGDIPDDQVFITYTSAHGFSLKVPEGWARKDTGDSVSFSDKYGQIVISTASASATAPFTTAGVKEGEAATLAKSGRAVKVSSVKDVKLPAGRAVVITFTSNSELNPVTGKQIKLENDRYLIANGGNQATMTFSAPAGADNADQWKLMAESFRWH
jgi:hypothetical protein